MSNPGMNEKGLLIEINYKILQLNENYVKMLITLTVIIRC
jgi:hypothetical protein